MKKLGIIFIFLIITMPFFAFAVKSETGGIDSHVIEKLKRQDKVEVIVSVENAVEKKFFGLVDNKITRGEIIEDIGKEKVEHEFSSSNSFSAVIDKKDIEKLKKISGIGIVEDKVFHAMLSVSTGIINASKTWPLQISGINLTGIGTTACILDSGVDYSHVDLGGCFGNNNASSSCKVIGGYDYCADNSACNTEDSDPEDVNGHGTHVAGIIAANGTVMGVAPGAKIVAIKIMNISGSASVSDTVAAIDWCVNNASVFNISVISMSLGAGLYTTYCDSEPGYEEISASINSAVAKNISVVIASGNDGSTISISSPACIENATAVGWANKDDTINTNSNRNSLVKLFAPGTSITSTKSSGGYEVRSGTSMATPHVAGAIALINQFLELTNQEKTPKEIETILDNTGKRINDVSNGLNFSRINVYDAVISLDNSVPEVTLISPSDNQINVSRNQTFSCNATDLSLKNATFYLWNSSNSLVNTSSASFTGASYTYSVNVGNLSFDSYKWNCLFYDENGNFNFSASNFTLTMGNIVTSLISPSNNNYTNLNYTDFSCQAETEASYSLENISFYLWNSTSLVYNETQSISGTLNTTNFNYTFVSEASYLWACLSWNNNSNSSLTGNYSITYDITKPNVSLAEPYPSDETSNSVSKLFYYNVSDNFNISRCDLIVNNIIVAGNSSEIGNSTNNITYTLTPGTYSWNINCSDIAGNQENSSSRSIIITALAIQTSSSGGGGGGGATAQIYTLTEEQTSSGYTKELGKSEKIKFTIFDEKAEQHELTVDYVGSNFVNLTLRSTAIKIVLGIGQSIKLNLTSSEYYDLYIKLEGIANNKAKLTIQTIHEVIQAETPPGEKGEEKGEVSETPAPDVDYGGFKKIWQTYSGLYIAVILGVILAGYLILKSFKKSIKLKVELNFKHSKKNK
ncbi:MAG: S8 family serine peptidase [Nanoarchaeota archaeon]